MPSHGGPDSAALAPPVPFPVPAPAPAPVPVPAPIPIPIPVPIPVPVLDRNDEIDPNIQPGLDVLQKVIKQITDVDVKDMKSGEDWKKIEDALFKEDRSTAEKQYSGLRSQENERVKRELQEAYKDLSGAILTALILDRARKASAKTCSIEILETAVTMNGFSPTSSVQDGTVFKDGDKFDIFLCPRLCEEWSSVLELLDEKLKSLHGVKNEWDFRYKEDLIFPDLDKSVDLPIRKVAEGLLRGFREKKWEESSPLKKEIAALKKLIEGKGFWEKPN